MTGFTFGPERGFPGGAALGHDGGLARRLGPRTGTDGPGPPSVPPWAKGCGRGFHVAGVKGGMARIT